MIYPLIVEARTLSVLGYFGEVSFQSIHFAFSTIIYLELRRRSGLCGTTRWKAAKATMANLDETGLEVAGCRHALALKALNMFRGEIISTQSTFLNSESLSSTIMRYASWSFLLNVGSFLNS